MCMHVHFPRTKIAKEVLTGYANILKFCLSSLTQYVGFIQLSIPSKLAEFKVLSEIVQKE